MQICDHPTQESLTFFEPAGIFGKLTQDDGHNHIMAISGGIVNHKISGFETCTTLDCSFLAFQTQAVFNRILLKVYILFKNKFLHTYKYTY